MKDAPALSQLRQKYLSKKNILLIALTIVIILFMIFYIGVAEFVEQLGSLNYFYIFLMYVTYTIQFLVRALSWYLIAKDLKSRAPYSLLYYSLGVGWMLNEIVPAKMGDLVRVQIVAKNTNQSFGTAAASVTLQRLIDLLIVLTTGALLIFIVIWMQGDDEGFDYMQVFSSIIIGVVLLSLVVVLFLVILKYPNWILGWIGKFSKKLEEFSANIILPFREAVLHLKSPVLLIYYFFLGIPIWFFDAMTFYFLFLALGLEISFFVVIISALINYLTKSIPLTPGGWGFSENIPALFILIFYPLLPFEMLLSAFIIHHLLIFIYCSSFGLISLRRISNISKKNIQINMADD